MKEKKQDKLSVFHYRIAQAVSGVVGTLVFGKKVRRNEIKGKKGPFVVIANHEAQLDFVSLIGATHRPMSFVISKCFYNTLPIKGFLDRMGVIPKQQFQTRPADLKRIKSALDMGRPVVIYPAGLMCEDGLSTPIPAATYKFLKWLDADVYAARVRGNYFVMPKWAKGMRAGRTYVDIYKLFSREELAAADIAEVKRATDEALLFDAYREQEIDRVRYENGDNVEGLQNVLYACPHCGSEFSIGLRGKRALRCSVCGYEQMSDGYGFLHLTGEVGEEIRYVSDWSRLIHDRLKERMLCGEVTGLSSQVMIHTIDSGKGKFAPAGEAQVTLTEKGFAISGQIKGEQTELLVSIANVPSLPFSPGKYFEIQNGQDIYRCYPEDGRLSMKFVTMVRIFSELRVQSAEQKGNDKACDI